MPNSLPRPARETRLTSGQLCEAAGVSRGALRLYEREKLIAAPPRSEGGYRLYPAEAVDILELVKLVKGLGFGLAETREMLELLGAEPDSERDLRELAARHLADVEARIAGLVELRDGLAAFAAGEPLEDDEDCAALARIIRARAAAHKKSPNGPSARGAGGEASISSRSLRS